jgi:anthranilate synthase component 2
MSKQILILDNYDSFTYNLVQQVRELSAHQVTVIRNDEIAVEEAGAYDAFILSPGPGLPSDSGILKPLISAYLESLPIFGVCLGMQAMAEVMGGELYNLAAPLHGVATEISLHQDPMFEGLGARSTVGRYHSWAVREDSLPASMRITSRDDEGVPMAFRHIDYPMSAVQFHPESILTEEGNRIIQNFLNTI